MLLCSCSSAGPCGIAASQRVKSRDVLFYLFSQSIFTGNDHEMPGKGRAFYSKDRDFAACAAFTFSEILRILRFPWSEWLVDVVSLIKELRILRHDRIPDFLSGSLVLGLM